MDAATQLAVHIRWMIRLDMPEVFDIERTSFDFPWSEDEFIRCLRQRNCIGMVAEYDERVLGYIIYELHKTSIHILNLAVSSQLGCRRRGIGSQLIAKQVNKLDWIRRNHIVADVCETNLEAQLFFRSQGFRATRILQQPWQESKADAYRMEYRLEWECLREDERCAESS